GQAFTLFDKAVHDYAAVSYLPQFLRGSVAENLPWIFFSKRKFARLDFQSIVTQFEENSGYANWKVMSFTYLGLAKQMQHKKFREQSLLYLYKAIALDPHYKAGREKAEELQHVMMQ
ncbi:MAG: hypothetical protein MUP99_02920, partial [Pedobacter sp.]|nr:hypothetical protein [Pedobacter sp.]